MKVEFATIHAARAFYAARRLNRNWPISLAVACCLILALYLRGELTYDRHFEGHENIYRIVEEFGILAPKGMPG